MSNELIMTECWRILSMYRLQDLDYVSLRRDYIVEKVSTECIEIKNLRIWLEIFVKFVWLQSLCEQKFGLYPIQLQRILKPTFMTTQENYIKPINFVFSSPSFECFWRHWSIFTGLWNSWREITRGVDKLATGRNQTFRGISDTIFHEGEKH